MPKTFIIFAVMLLAGFRAGAFIDVDLQMQLGNPSNATSDTNNLDHFLIQRTVEAMDYNNTLGQPNWASWDLTTNDFGDSGRSEKFYQDTSLPPNFHWVGIGEYGGSGYDRGHLCPSADRTDNTNDNNLVFLMSNMMPQTSANNSGVWANFESYCRSLCQADNDELLIICGPSGFDGSRINTNGYVWIPQYTWKIAVVVPPGNGDALSRITATNRVIAIKVPNTNGVSSVWQNFITSASQIQVDTGLTFFTALPDDVAAVLRNRVDGQTNPPPIIFAFTPTSGPVNASVVIAGTNFTMATQVTFNGTSAGFAVDSGAQITATVPTNAGSGFISVTTVSGTAISTNRFTVLNHGGSVYSGILAGWDAGALPGGLNNYGPSPFAPTTNAANLSVTGLTRGSGVKTSGTAAVGGWGGTGFTNLTGSSAIAADQFVTFGLTVGNGFTVSLTSLSRFDYYRSGSGPDDGVLQFQIGDGVFTDITNLSYPISGKGASIEAIDLSGFAALQDVGAGTNVVFRIVNYHGGSAGTWYVYDKAGSSAPDLAVQGTITQIVPEAPAFAALSYTNGQFQFMVTGTTGSSYVVQAATNLASPDWIPLLTNTAPFVFIQSNATALGQIFYRGMAQ